MNIKKMVSLCAVLILAFAFAGSANAASLTVSSDADTQWSSDGSNWNPAFVGSYVYSGWASVSDASWIWTVANNGSVNDYGIVPDGGWYFQKTFEIPECSAVTSATLYVNADNSESSTINGHFLGQDGNVSKNGPDGYEWKTLETYDIADYVISGENTLLFRATNYFNYANPTGLIFKAVINYKLDSDCDGVFDADDMCSDTVPDKPTVDLGVNRHIWSGEGFVTLIPKGKGIFEQVDSLFTMQYTYGCSCAQILDMLKDEGLGEFGGHYKFGCSKSVIEDFKLDLSDEVLDGRYFIERVTVPSNQTIAKASAPINPALTYVLKASGTYQYASWAGGPVADTKCSYRTASDPLHLSGWVSGDNLPAPYTNYLEVRVNGGVVDWGVASGSCNPSNIYEMEMTGVDRLEFNVYDGGAIGDNKGNLSVDIYAQL